MQIPNSQLSSAENVKEYIDTGLKMVPRELVSIIPESVWVSLSLDQKKDILRQHNLYEKYIKSAPVEEVVVKQNDETAGGKVEVIVTEQPKAEKNPEFAQAVEDMKKVEQEKEAISKPILTQEEIARINAEKATKQNNANYKFFGYQPSTTLFSNAKSISDDQPVSDAKTWAATLISKIFSLFQ